MSYHQRILQVYQEAGRLDCGPNSRLVFVSDCHRGDGDNGDNFARNQNLYYTALRHYYDGGYTYIELGDGDDLWEIKRFQDIADTYGNVFSLLRKFLEKDRLHMLYGNHDHIKARSRWVEGNLHQCRHDTGDACVPLLPGLVPVEGLVLRWKAEGREMLLLHGHQADFFNDRMWLLSRFLVRYLWHPLESVGMRDPFSASHNRDKRLLIDRRLQSFAQNQGILLVAGHTHRPLFPGAGEPAYFNDGSCVHPRHITAIEVDQGQISLVSWSIQARRDGVLYVGRAVLQGPRSLSDCLAGI